MARIRKPKLNPLVIERQDVVQEVRITSPELIRLSRVKYEGNDYTFVDIRRLWRAYDEDSNEVFHPSPQGLQLKGRDFLKLIESYLAHAEQPLDREDTDVH